MGIGKPFNRERLLAITRGGAPDVVGQLLEPYRNYLALLARVHIGQRLQGKADASDLVQETFLQAYQALEAFRGNSEEELLRWLRQILASRLAKLVRRYCTTKGRNVRLERGLDEELDRSSQGIVGLAVPGSTPSQSAARHERAVLVADALARLPADYREVLILRHMEELSFPEMARRMNQSLGSVERLWIRSLAALRQSLGVKSHVSF